MAHHPRVDEAGLAHERREAVAEVVAKAVTGFSTRRTSRNQGEAAGATTQVEHTVARPQRIIMKAEVLCYPGRLRWDTPLVSRHQPAASARHCLHAPVLRSRRHGKQAERTAAGRCHRPDQLLAVTANQLRLLSAVATYVLFQTLQSFARATALGSAQGWKLRERLVKIAVWVERSVRRIYLES